MSLPIAPTPTLKGKEAREFLKRVKEQENIPSYLVPTPKLKSAMSKIWMIQRGGDIGFSNE